MPERITLRQASLSNSNPIVVNASGMTTPFRLFGQATNLWQWTALVSRVTDDGFTIRDDQAKQMNVAMAWKNLGAFEDLQVERLTNGK